jgi:hypothetical protein
MEICDLDLNFKNHIPSHRKWKTSKMWFLKFVDHLIGENWTFDSKNEDFAWLVWRVPLIAADTRCCRLHHDISNKSVFKTWGQPRMAYPGWFHYLHWVPRPQSSQLFSRLGHSATAWTVDPQPNRSSVGDFTTKNPSANSTNNSTRFGFGIIITFKAGNKHL